jgi:hypothetical protein
MDEEVSTSSFSPSCSISTFFLLTPSPFFDKLLQSLFYSSLRRQHTVFTF